jgi:RNA polymerase sigma-70 factor (ECF subfamily)
MDENSRQLVLQAKDGSETAQNRIIQQVSGRLLALIRLRLGSSLRRKMESRDILQNTLLKAFSNLDDFKGERSGSLVSWLMRIAENEIRDQARYHQRQRRDAGQETPLGDLGSRQLVERVRTQTSRLTLGEEISHLERALETMDESYREIIVLRKFEELPFAVIGSRLGKSPDACRMLLARAMADLTVRLREES